MLEELQRQDLAIRGQHWKYILYSSYALALSATSAADQSVLIDRSSHSAVSNLARSPSSWLQHRRKFYNKSTFWLSLSSEIHKSMYTVQKVYKLKPFHFCIIYLNKARNHSHTSQTQFVSHFSTSDTLNFVLKCHLLVSNFHKNFPTHKVRPQTKYSPSTEAGDWGH